jgi:hypothetical protein
MKNDIDATLRDKTSFWIGMFWCVAVFGSYLWLNKPYYMEKIYVFVGHLIGMIS